MCIHWKYEIPLFVQQMALCTALALNIAQHTIEEVSLSQSLPVFPSSACGFMEQNWSNPMHKKAFIHVYLAVTLYHVSTTTLFVFAGHLRPRCLLDNNCDIIVFREDPYLAVRPNYLTVYLKTMFWKKLKHCCRVDESHIRSRFAPNSWKTFPNTHRKINK